MLPTFSAIKKSSISVCVFLALVFSTAMAFAEPTINSPAPGTQLPGSSVTFSWSANGTSVSQWWIHVGTSQGGFELFDSGSLGGALSTTVSGLPTDGSSDVWVRLWYLDPSSWKSIDVQYTAGTGGGGGGSDPTMTSPTPGTELPGSSATFSWNANGTAVSQWWIHVGTSQGATDIFDSGSLGGALSTTVSGLPTTGGSVWVRLWYLDPSSWKSIDVQYTAASGGGGGGDPTMSSPAPGTILSGSMVTFSWTPNGTSVSQWWIHVGTSKGALDIFDSGSLGGALSSTVSGIPTSGGDVWVRLWYLDSSWKSIDAQYTASTGGGINITTPPNNSLHTSTSVLVQVTATGFPSNWGVEFVINGDEGNSIEDFAQPFETTVTGLSKTEHSVTAHMIDENSVRQASTSVNFGVGDYYVGFGDSINFGVGDNISSDDTSNDGRNSGGGFTPILNNLLTSAKGFPHTIVNETIPGFESGDGLAVVGDAINSHPSSQYFLILFGTNDSTPPMPVPSGLNLSPGQSGYAGSFKDNMKQIIDAIKNAGKHPLLSKVPIRYGDCSSSSECNSYPNPATAQANLDIQDYNMVVDQLISENNLDVDPINNPGTLLIAPDLYTYFENTGVDGQGKSPEFFDWLHPNGVGYQSLSNLWLQSLTP